MEDTGECWDTPPVNFHEKLACAKQRLREANARYEKAAKMNKRAEVFKLLCEEGERDIAEHAFPDFAALSPYHFVELRVAKEFLNAYIARDHASNVVDALEFARTVCLR